MLMMDFFFPTNFDGNCTRLCRSRSCPLASSAFSGNSLVIKPYLKRSRASLKLFAEHHMLPFGLFSSSLSVYKQRPAPCVVRSWGGSRCVAGSPEDGGTAAVPRGQGLGNSA